MAVDASDASTDAGDNAAAFADVADVADDSAAISWRDGKSSALLSAAALMIVLLDATDPARGRRSIGYAATR